MDDNVCTHTETAVLKKVMELVEKEVGKITTRWRKEHLFLGMRLRFNVNGTVTICMKDYVVKVLHEFAEKVRKKASSPAKNDLFTINHSSPRLNKERGELFHN